MHKNKALSRDKRVKERPLISKIMLSMILLGLLEVTIFGIRMLSSGELSYIRKYCYNFLTEKTENRASYVENTLTQKTSLVYEAALKINDITESYLDENGLSLDALKTDKNVNKEISARSAETLISLIRRDMVNDAFIILDTGELYSSDKGEVRAGIYLRDTDVYTNSTDDYKDIYLEMGSSELAYSLGTPLDFEWSPHLTIDADNDYSFYTVPMETYSANSRQPIYNLGYWSGLSKISLSASKSLKYTLPLVTSDGEVYGVIGIGLMEKNLLANMPANDFFSTSACYMIGKDIEGDGVYEPIIHSGAIYNRLVTSQTVFDENAESNNNVYRFNIDGKSYSLGAIHRMTLYNSGSPYINQHWALVSAASTSSVMSIYDFLMKVFIVSVIITIACCILFSVYTGKRISDPVAKMITALDNAQNDMDSVLTFGQTGISEIDKLALSIIRLQVNANEYASRISKIITLTDSSIGIFMIHLNDHTVYVSESLTDILGFDDIPHKDIVISEEKFQEQLRWIDKEQKALDPDFNTDSPEAMKNLKSGKSIEIRSERDGVETWFRFTISVLNDDIIGLVQDITESVTEKKQIAQHKDDEYTEKLVKANKALRDAYSNAKRADNAKTDFLSRMSHDIRTPMNAIIGMTVIANSHIDDKEKVEDCLDKISVSGNYLLSIINDVLDMSKIESGKFTLNEENINLCKMLDGFMEIVKTAAKEKHHTLTLNKHDIVHENIIGDSLRLQQMFVNIVSNSIKYTNDGGNISIDVTEKAVGNKNVGCYEFVFKDNGIGMSEEFLKNIFEPFERAEDERVCKQQGTGLGMAIAYNLVKMMNGEIHVDSKLGEGSVFTVTIFFKIGSDAEEQVSTSSYNGVKELQSADYSGERILLVDDNELNLEIAEELLEMTGLTIDEAMNGLEAVEKFRNSEQGFYKLVFMDIQMPVMNGYEAAETIRKLDRSDAKTVPIIAMTADAFAEDVKKAHNAGMNEHIAKPLDIGKLAAVLKEWLPKEK